MKALLIAGCAALLTFAAPAQVSGSINRNAPTVMNSITMGANKLELTYTSIRFGQGQWQQIKDNADMHERFNAGAERKPIGQVKTSVDLVAAGKQVPAGEYSLYFTVHEQAGWILNLKPADGKAISWRLILEDTDAKHECMMMSLMPSAQADTCSLTVAFGAQSVTVPVRVATQEKKDG